MARYAGQHSQRLVAGVERVERPAAHAETGSTWRVTLGRAAMLANWAACLLKKFL